MTASMFFRTSLTTGTIICFCVIGLFCLLWQGYIFLALKKCQNKEQSVTTLTINMEHYKLHSKARLIMTLPLLIIILIILYILESKNMNPIIMYGVLPISILGVIFSIPYEIKHLRDISSYMNTLHELKEDYQ